MQNGFKQTKLQESELIYAFEESYYRLSKAKGIYADKIARIAILSNAQVRCDIS